mgnify:CR=1 FL=1
MKFDIPNPCSADWNKMKIGIQSRYCNSCEKSVVDFTEKTREEILTYLLMHKHQRVCGHIRRSQLDFKHEEIMVVIDGMTRQEKKTNLPFYILCAGALILSSCSTEPTTTGKITSPVETVDTVVIEDSTTQPKIGKVCVDSIPESPFKPPVLHTIGEIIDGDVILVDSIEEPIEFDSADAAREQALLEQQVHQFVEVMPEYPGGVDSLMDFLKTNVQYPKMEKEMGIEGVVVVQFIVEKTGELSNFKIVKPVKGGPNFDKEVLRVMRLMQNWTPGTQQGRPVRVQYHLPVRFRLKN